MIPEIRHPHGKPCIVHRTLWLLLGKWLRFDVSLLVHAHEEENLLRRDGYCDLHVLLIGVATDASVMKEERGSDDNCGLETVTD